MTYPVEIESVIRNLRLVVFDFDGVFTDNTVYVSEDGTETVRCNRSDGYGLQRLREAGIDTVIVSSEVNPVVSIRAAKLKIEVYHGCENKKAMLLELMKKKQVEPQQLAYLGNDINDRECLQLAGLPVVVADAWEEIRPLAAIKLSRSGGHGAVRELCNIIWNLVKQGKNNEPII